MRKEITLTKYKRIKTMYDFPYIVSDTERNGNYKMLLA